ncbi:hypothetical protein EDD63_10768 [Breznakia blatticola]|uniref:Uncharacterized protein n=1 Tax=Breznakia blatticola TaxID=1754012 RepID=A0A4R8A3R1_9FIRM|nr:hypothetical protein [Breznakia blatticola]TDW24916.1 hypothetical protein EDD63_10768 [Breznakia blatticola]
MKKYLVYRTGDDKTGKMLNMKLKNFKVGSKDGKWILKNDGKMLMIFDDYNEAEFFFDKLTDFRTTDAPYLDLNEVKKYWEKESTKTGNRPIK